jgi:hypothetical protein
MILDSIKKRSWACHSHPARPRADGKHLNHITPGSMAGRYSLSLGLFVHLRIRFHSICSFLFAASSTNARPGGLYSGLSSAPPSPPKRNHGSNCCWIYPFGRRSNSAPSIRSYAGIPLLLYTTRRRLTLLVTAALEWCILIYCPAPLPPPAPLAYRQQS